MRFLTTRTDVLQNILGNSMLKDYVLLNGVILKTFYRKEVRNEQKKADRINHKLVEVL